MKLKQKLSMLGLILVVMLSCQNKQSATNTEKTGNMVYQVPSKADVYLTCKTTDDRLTKKDAVTFETSAQPDEAFPTIFIDPSKTYQSIVGIGGAFTDASAETFYKLPKDKQDEIMTAYFDREKGIGYSLGRTHIHSCDFSSESYTYLKDGDTTFQSFSIEHDMKYRIPFIKEALKKAGEPITFFSSPWSPPAWMKTNNDMLHGGKLKPEYFRTWANYYVYFIKAYQKEGIPIWGTTVQNEPMATQTWESCLWTAEDERDFIKTYLGPTLTKSGLDIKLMCWDHNRGIMYQRAKTVLDDPEAAKYVWGTAFHWYVGNHFENVRAVHEAFPDKNLLFTEGCTYPFDFNKINDWNWGEEYGRSMINDFNNWACGWTDWNLILDEKGGPNHVNNFCNAPIIGDTKTGKVYYMNSFYYLGHFSKFIRPEAKRISCTSSTDDLIATSFINKTGKVAVVIMNEKDKDINFQIWVEGKIAKSKLPAHSIMTVVL